MQAVKSPRPTTEDASQLWNLRPIPNELLVEPPGIEPTEATWTNPKRDAHLVANPAESLWQLVTGGSTMFRLDPGRGAGFVATWRQPRVGLPAAR
jgi:hypothetical protein